MLTTVVMTGRKERVLLVLAGLAVVLNLLDGVFTLVWVEAGLATEANPIMDFLLSGSPVAFMVGKLSMVSCGVHLLHRYQEKLMASAGLVGSVVVYAGILVFHLSAL